MQLVSDALERAGAATRPSRVARQIWLSQHILDVGPTVDRTETSALMDEARTSYLFGNNIAALTLALAYIEHALNDALPPVPGEDKKLSPMIAVAIRKARFAGLFTPDLLDSAELLSHFRNAYMHRRDHDDPDTLGSRMVSRKTHPRTIGEHDAKDALGVMYGFFHHSLRQP